VSGLLMISAKIFRNGDVIMVGDLKGVVTDISLRTTKLRTYDRNEVIIPNSVLLKENVINLTSGKKETVASIIFAIDYIYDTEKVKLIIENMIKNDPNVIVILKKEKKREIRFVVRIKEWSTEIECLFWINEPANEEFIKSRITENVNNRLKEEKILPPIPGVLRKEYLERKNQQPKD
ncbi:mechanosensitive ion channel family protein, partial [Thermoproteota archaeon]